MEESDLPSKTQRKKQMHALQDTGAALVKLNAAQLAQLTLPERLLRAVLEAKRLTKHEAVRRQMQYIGKLMREIDATPIQAQLDAWQGGNDLETAKLHAIERWRDQLLADESKLADLLAAYPEADGQALRALIRNTRKERETQRPPKHYRALFRELRRITGGGANPEPEE